MQNILAENRLQNEEFMLEFVDMIKDYYSSLEATGNTNGLDLLSLSTCFTWASTIPATSNVLFYPVHALYFKQCHDSIYKLDEMASDTLVNQPAQKVNSQFLSSFLSEIDYFVYE